MQAREEPGGSTKQAAKMRYSAICVVFVVATMIAFHNIVSQLHGLHASFTIKLDDPPGDMSRRDLVDENRRLHIENSRLRKLLKLRGAEGRDPDAAGAPGPSLAALDSRPGPAQHAAAGQRAAAGATTTGCNASFWPGAFETRESMLQAGWEVMLDDVAFGSHFEGWGGAGEPGHGFLRLTFHGVGVMAIHVRNPPPEGEGGGDDEGQQSVLVHFSGVQLVELERNDGCNFYVSYRPGDELKIALQRHARVRVGDVQVLGHTCEEGDAAGGSAGARPCGDWQQVQLGWSGCVAAPSGGGDQHAHPDWSEGRIEQFINRTHAGIRITSPPLEKAFRAAQAVFNPKSPLVSYQDEGTCGARGDDALADEHACPRGLEVVARRDPDNWKVMARVDGCNYFAYTIYRCKAAFQDSLVVLPATRLSPLSADTPRGGPPAEVAVAPRCTEFRLERKNIGIILVGDKGFQAKYMNQIRSQECFAKRHGYKLIKLSGSEYAVCRQYTDYFFKKHCTVAEFLESQPADFVAAVIDADVAAIPMDRGLERWANYDADVQLYERCLLTEIMAGNYMVRNTPFARKFLRRWASYNHEKPAKGFSSSDNGALHLVVMETVQVEGVARCKKLYQALDMPVTNLTKYWKYVACTKEALGPPRAWRVNGGSLTVWPMMHFYVTDGMYWHKIASPDLGPVMHHGIKDNAAMVHHYYKRIERCELDSDKVMKTNEEFAEQALKIATSYTDHFPQGDGCRQCVGRCMSTFSCPSLGNIEAPLPRRTCTDCS